MYSGATEVTPVALEGSPSSAPHLNGAACAGNLTLDWFPLREPETVPAEISELCSQCPVRSECLSWALAFDATGLWAGTTTRQRRGTTDSEATPNHKVGEGSPSRYRRGCRCPECRQAQTARIRRQRNKHRGA